MKATKERATTQTMGFVVRPLRSADIRQSEEIERDAFPTLFPPTSFRSELTRRNAAYLVAWRQDRPAQHAGNSTGRRATPRAVSRPRALRAVVKNVRGLWSQGAEETQEFIAGFLGAWYMADEAHIVAVGVRREYRSRGIGELLLIAAIEHAMARRAAAVTLEVRVSNDIAKALYSKYGFTERGVRKSYYADNREDAIIMTTDPILSPEYAELFHRLRLDHQRRWGPAERELF